MSRRKRKSEESDLEKLAASLGPEDGGDPKEFHAKPWDAPKKAGRKSQQLCGQVQDALTVVFPSCADDVLRGLTVASVVPAPHTGRLLVVVGAPSELDRSQVASALARATGFLRSEVARAISRRHAPELTFDVIGCDGDDKVRG